MSNVLIIYKKKYHANIFPRSKIGARQNMNCFSEATCSSDA